MKIYHTFSICLLSLTISNAFGAACPTGTGSGTTIGAINYNCEKTSAYYPIIGSTVYSCTKCNTSNEYLTSHTSTYGNCDITYKTCECYIGYYFKNSSCERCPEYEPGKPGSTIAPGATDITQCYIPSSTFSDSTGSGSYASPCYYSN